MNYNGFSPIDEGFKLLCFRVPLQEAILIQVYREIFSQMALAQWVELVSKHILMFVLIILVNNVVNNWKK
jgi:hypothetical protein